MAIASKRKPMICSATLINYNSIVSCFMFFSFLIQDRNRASGELLNKESRQNIDDMFCYIFIK